MLFFAGMSHYLYNECAFLALSSVHPVMIITCSRPSVNVSCAKRFTAPSGDACCRQHHQTCRGHRGICPLLQQSLDGDGGLWIGSGDYWRIFIFPCEGMIPTHCLPQATIHFCAWHHHNEAAHWMVLSVLWYSCNKHITFGITLACRRNPEDASGALAQQRRHVR